MSKSFGNVVLGWLLCSRVFAQGSAPVATLEVAAQPALFGENVISTQDHEINATFTPDGKAIFFSKALPGWSRLTIVTSERRGGKWQEPRVASFSGQYRDADPFISPDGQRLFFISDRPVDGQPRKTYSLWAVAHREDGSWGIPQLVPGPANTLPNPAYPSVAANGNLYFSSGDAVDSEIYCARWRNGQYEAPEKLSFNRAAYRDLDPIVASDESFLIFSSLNRPGFGSSDLYVSFRRNNTWEEPIVLGKTINSPLNEGQAGLSPDNHRLYFTSSVVPVTGYRSQALFYPGLLAELRGVYNGLGNIYEVDISQIWQRAHLVQKPD
jgi:Tol biopolymer transport system component